MITPNHEKFLNHLDNSEDAVWHVMRMFSKAGNPVWKNPTTKARTAAQWQEHADGGDFWIGQRVEVKKLSVDFTCAADWPFRSKFIVCAKHAWDSASPKPIGYCILSQDGTHLAYVKGSTSPEWYVEKRTDSRYDSVSQDFYFCPLDLVYWTKIDG